MNCPGSSVSDRFQPPSQKWDCGVRLRRGGKEAVFFPSLTFTSPLNCALEGQVGGCKPLGDVGTHVAKSCMAQTGNLQLGTFQKCRGEKRNSGPFYLFLILILNSCALKAFIFMQNYLLLGSPISYFA